MWLETCGGDLAGRPEHLNRAPAHPTKVEGDINNGTFQHFLYWRDPTDDGGLQWFPSLLCLVSFDHLLFRSGSISPSCLSGVIALYTGDYFSVFVGEGEFSILLHCCHLGSTPYFLYLFL